MIFAGIEQRADVRSDIAVLCSLASGGGLTEIANAGPLGTNETALVQTGYSTPLSGIFFYYVGPGPIDMLGHVTADGVFEMPLSSRAANPQLTYLGNAFYMARDGNFGFANEEFSGLGGHKIKRRDDIESVNENDWIANMMQTVEPSATAATFGAASDFSKSIVCMTTSTSTAEVYRIE